MTGTLGFLVAAFISSASASEPTLAEKTEVVARYVLCNTANTFGHTSSYNQYDLKFTLQTSVGESPMSYFVLDAPPYGQLGLEDNLYVGTPSLISLDAGVNGLDGKDQVVAYGKSQPLARFSLAEQKNILFTYEHLLDRSLEYMATHLKKCPQG